MSILVLAEHDNASLKGATLNTIAAAKAIGGDIVVLVAGANCGAVGEEAAAPRARSQPWDEQQHVQDQRVSVRGQMTSSWKEEPTAHSHWSNADEPR